MPLNGTYHYSVAMMSICGAKTMAPNNTPTTLLYGYIKQGCASVHPRHFNLMDSLSPVPVRT